MMRTFDKCVSSHSSSFYFGKIPSRSDFVKSVSGTKVIGLMDQWIAHGMEMLMAMPDWKTSFDSAGPFDFLFIGMKRRHAIHGTIAPSRDASDRRFPLVAATAFELADPPQFLRLGPLALEDASRSRRHLMHHAIEARDMPHALDLLDSRLQDSDLQIHAAEARCATYLAAHSLASLGGMLTQSPDAVPLGRMIPALGKLLLSLRSNPAVSPQKAIALPLPRQEDERIDAMTFWLQLVSAALVGSTVELSLFSGMHIGIPRLIIAFNGVTPTVFQSLFDEQTSNDFLIDLAQTQLDEQDGSVLPSCPVLSSHLEHPEITALQLVASFRSAFG